MESPAGMKALEVHAERDTHDISHTFMLELLHDRF
jgi:hypothetical protein